MRTSRVVSSPPFFGYLSVTCYLELLAKRLNRHRVNAGKRKFLSWVYNSESEVVGHAQKELICSTQIAARAIVDRQSAPSWADDLEMQMRWQTRRLHALRVSGKSSCADLLPCGYAIAAGH